MGLKILSNPEEDRMRKLKLFNLQLSELESTLRKINSEASKALDPTTNEQGLRAAHRNIIELTSPYLFDDPSIYRTQIDL